MELIRQTNVLKQGAKSIDIPSKYNPKEKSKYKLRIWMFKSASMQCENTIINNHILPGWIRNTTKTGLNTEERSWLIKSVRTAIAINEDLSQLIYLKKICIDQSFATKYMEQFSENEWKQLTSYIFNMKDPKKHTKLWNNVLNNPSDLSTVDLNTLFGSNKKLVQMLKDNNIYFNVCLIKNTYHNVNNYIYDKTYHNLAQSFLRINKSKTMTERLNYPETFLLSEYNNDMYLINISSFDGKLLMGWYSEYMNNTKINQTVVPDGINASQLILAGMAFNLGYSEDRKRIHDVMILVTTTCEAMEYYSDQYLQCAVEYFSNAINYQNTNFSNINDICDVKLVLKDKYNINLINDVIRKVITQRIKLIKNAQLSDSSIADTYKSITRSLDNYALQNPLLIVDEDNKDYQKYIDMYSSVTLSCNRIILHNKQATMKLGLLGLKLIDKTTFNNYYKKLSNEENNELRPEISIVSNKIKNGTDSILTSKSLMNRDARPIELNVNNQLSSPNNINDEYEFLALTKRCLRNIRYHDVKGICIENTEQKELDELQTYICNNCEIELHIDCVFKGKEYLYYSNPSKLWLCGSCSNLTQMHGAIYLKTKQEIAQLGETPIIDTIKYLTDSINANINGSLNISVCGINFTNYSQYLQIIYNIAPIRQFLIYNYAAESNNYLMNFAGIILNQMLNKNYVDVKQYAQSFLNSITNNNWNNLSQTMKTIYLLNGLINELNSIIRSQTKTRFINLKYFDSHFTQSDKCENDENNLLHIVTETDLSSDILVFYYENNTHPNINVDDIPKTHGLQIISINQNDINDTLVFCSHANSWIRISNELLYIVDDISKYKSHWNMLIYVANKYKLSYAPINDITVINSKTPSVNIQYHSNNNSNTIYNNNNENKPNLNDLLFTSKENNNKNMFASGDIMNHINSTHTLPLSNTNTHSMNLSVTNYMNNNDICMHHNYNIPQMFATPAPINNANNNVNNRKTCISQETPTPTTKPLGLYLPSLNEQSNTPTIFNKDDNNNKNGKDTSMINMPPQLTPNTQRKSSTYVPVLMSCDKPSSILNIKKPSFLYTPYVPPTSTPNQSSRNAHILSPTILPPTDNTKKRKIKHLNTSSKRQKTKKITKKVNNKTYYWYNDHKRLFSQLEGDLSNIWKNTQNMNEASLKAHLKKLNLKSDQMRDFCTIQNIKVKIVKPLMINKLVEHHLKERVN